MSDEKFFKLEPKLLKSCIPAMSNEPTRYYLCGVHIFERDGQLIYEATNGHLLVRIVSYLEQDEDISGLDIIVPACFVKELSKKSFLKGYGADELTFLDAVLDAQTLRIEMPEGIVSIKLVDGTFPDTDRVIPKEASCKGLSFDTFGANLKHISSIEKSIKAISESMVSLAFSGDEVAPIVFEKMTDHGAWKSVLTPTRTSGEIKP